MVKIDTIQNPLIILKANHVNAHHNLALALKESGKFKSAIKSHYMAIKYEPENTIKDDMYTSNGLKPKSIPITASDSCVA